MRAADTDVRPHVRDIAFSGREGTGEFDIAVSGDAAVSDGSVTRSHCELILDGVELADVLVHTTDLTRYGSPVRSVTASRDPGIARRVHLYVELIAPSTPSRARHGDHIIWHIEGDDMP